MKKYSWQVDFSDTHKVLQLTLNRLEEEGREIFAVLQEGKSEGYTVLSLKSTRLPTSFENTQGKTRFAATKWEEDKE